MASLRRLIAKPSWLSSAVSAPFSTCVNVMKSPPVLLQAPNLCRNASSCLVLADHSNGDVNPATYSTISAAKQLGGDITALVCGPDCSKVAGELAKAEGVGKLLVAQDEGFKGFLPEALSPLILAAQKQFGFTHIIGCASAIGKVRGAFIIHSSLYVLTSRMSYPEWQPS